MKPKHLSLPLAWALLLFFGLGIAQSQSLRTEYQRKELIQFAGDVHIKPGESIREVVLIGGQALIEGEVGELVVIMGSATVHGTINRNMTVVLGSAELGTNAVVGRDIVVVGGNLVAPPEAEIGGNRTEVAFLGMFPEMQWLKDWFRYGFLLGRPLPHQLAWAWGLAGVLTFLYMMFAILFPRPMRATVEALEKKPAGSLLVGVLFCVLIGPVILLLLASVVAVVVIPFLFCAAILMVLFGKAAVLQYTGMQAGRQIRVAFLQSPVVAVVTGAAIFCVFYMIPFLGFLVWGLATLFGMGAVLMALFAGLRRERSNGRALPDPVATPVPAMAASAEGTEPASTGHSDETAWEERSAPPLMLELPGSERAGVTVRLGATLLDLVVVLVLVWLLNVIVKLDFSGFVFLWLAYHIGMWAWKRSTIGGLAFGLQLVRLDGRPMNFAVALVRGLAGILSIVPFFLGFFWAAWDPEKQSWHDKIAGTVVVRAPKGVSLL
jgi:uncharacterized RDD family membrane protein YckC